MLVELGYLSNAHDVASLRSQEWRERTAEAMRAAIDGFFAGEPGSFAASAPRP